MRSTLIARLLLGAVAIAVTLSLVAMERDHDGCQEAMRSAFLASAAPGLRLQHAAERLADSCENADPLERIAVGLRAERPRAAALLARAAAEREPDSYVAWGVLAVTAPPAEAARAERRARALNPLSAATARP